LWGAAQDSASRLDEIIATLSCAEPHRVRVAKIERVINYSGRLAQTSRRFFPWRSNDARKDAFKMLCRVLNETGLAAARVTSRDVESKIRVGRCVIPTGPFKSR
jgi:hypothetical protein